MESILVGMFDTRAEAEQAHARLVAAGFDASALSLTNEESASAAGSSLGSSSGAESGPSGTPTDTSAMSAGTASTHSHQGPIARFFERLFGSDDADTEGHADTYREAFRRGAFGLTVHVRDTTELDRAQAILSDAGAVDIDTRAETWRQEGWTGGRGTVVMGAGMPSSTGDASTLQTGTTRTLPEVEEELKVGKRTVSRGGVRIFSRMVETPVEESVTLREEHANVQRRAVDRLATEAELSGFKEGSIEVRETAEEAVVSKSARVVGEVEISKSATERDETVHETLRRTEVEVEPIEGGSTTGSGLASGTAGRGVADQDESIDPSAVTSPSQRQS